MLEKTLLDVKVKFPSTFRTLPVPWTVISSYFGLGLPKKS